MLPETSEAAAPPVAATAAPPPATLAQPQLAASPPAPAERAEPRAPAPQLESAIHQVGEIREALRSARPEMTLRHAEFGFVSLRLEAAGGAQDWRAVLASRDPGFVPAIQAALAERAVTATADAAGTGSGTGHGAASSDQRYGSSPNGGQGSSQPYLGQSGQRDEGASQHQRGQQRRADEAGSAAAPETGEAEHRNRGLFA